MSTKSERCIPNSRFSEDQTQDVDCGMYIEHRYLPTITTSYWSRLHPTGRQEGGVVFEKESRTFPF